MILKTKICQGCNNSEKNFSYKLCNDECISVIGQVNAQLKTETGQEQVRNKAPLSYPPTKACCPRFKANQTGYAWNKTLVAFEMIETILPSWPRLGVILMSFDFWISFTSLRHFCLTLKIMPTQIWGIKIPTKPINPFKLVQDSPD